MNEGAQTSKVGFSLGGKCLAGTAMGFGGWGELFGGGWVGTVKKGNRAGRMNGPGDGWGERRDKLAARRRNHGQDKRFVRHPFLWEN